MANNRQQNYYSNPAFSQQSEYYNSRGPPVSPGRQQSTPRQSPIGAQASVRVVDTSFSTEKPIPGPKPRNGNYEEQEFYEEMLVDDAGFVKQKKIVVLTSPNLDRRNGNVVKCVRKVDESSSAQKYRYTEVASSENDRRHRYEEIEDSQVTTRNRSNINHRYEYIPVNQNEYTVSPQTSPKRVNLNATKEGYALVRRNDKYELLPLEKVSDTYRYSAPQKHRYEYIPQNNGARYQVVDDIHEEYPIQQSTPVKVTSPHAARRHNPAATQKLHELLSTPQKKPSPGVRKDPFISPVKTRSPPRDRTPRRAQQKLNYALSTRNVEKRHTAIIAPICSSPVQSVYSETTCSNKTESWMNLSISKAPIQATLTVAAVMMILCGSVTSGLCFYMVSIMGRLYYLDFGIVSGFTCLILGLLGFRSRNCYWLPNRNYISGYIVLSVFSLLTCAGLLVLLFTHPKPGSPLADMTSGAVCGISVLSLVLASAGVIASYCCKYPPPDNRVEHCARGFTV